MADLINRDLTIHELEAFKESCIANFMRMSFDDIIDVVKDIPAVNRWISVEDALPEKDKSDITYSETTKYCNHNEIPEESRINILYFNGEEWYDEECRYYNVTHYMPIPEPPEKE